MWSPDLLIYITFLSFVVVVILFDFNHLLDTFFQSIRQTSRNGGRVTPLKLNILRKQSCFQETSDFPIMSQHVGKQA